MSGTFGYELDLQTLSDEEKEQVRSQIHTYRSLQPLLLQGRYDRLTDAATDRYFTAWQLTAADQSTAVINLVVLDPQANPWPIHIRPRHLDPKACLPGFPDRQGLFRRRPVPCRSDTARPDGHLPCCTDHSGKDGMKK